MLGKPAAFDITPLNPSTFTEASVTAGSAALAAEQRKHNADDVKWVEVCPTSCGELWVQHLA